MFVEVDKEIIQTDDPTVIKIRQKLFPEEEKMPLAKYFYNYPPALSHSRGNADY